MNLYPPISPRRLVQILPGHVALACLTSRVAVIKAAAALWPAFDLAGVIRNIGSLGTVCGIPCAWKINAPTYPRPISGRTQNFKPRIATQAESTTVDRVRIALRKEKEEEEEEDGDTPRVYNARSTYTCSPLFMSPSCSCERRLFDGIPREK